MDAHISSNPLINKPYNIKRPHPTEEAAGETCDGQPSSKKLPESPTHNTEFDSPDLTGDQRGAAFKRLKVIRIPDPEKYLKSPDMLHPDYIGTAAPKELQKHIKHVRKGQRGKQDGGLIYWEYLKAQQTALKALGEEVAKHPSEIIFTMERGGTFLYDCLETYIPEKGRPKAVISTAKLEENTWAATMEYLLRQIQEAYDQGYRRIGLVEVSVTGGQMLYILRHLSEYTEKLERAGAKLETSTELHLYVMQQTIVTSPEFVNSQRKKQETIVSNNSFIHFHSVKTPFLHGEDVDKYLEYGENQTVPVNVIHSEKGLLQLYSDEGPRGTLRNLMAGRYQALESLSEKTVSIKPEDTPDSTTSSEKASRDSQSRMEKLKDVTAQKRLPNFINYPPQPCKIVKKTSETEVLPAQNKQPHNQTPFEQLNVVRITNPEIFIAQPEALTPDFLESPDLEPDEVCRRIELIRKGHRHREGAGIIYWKYLQQQQDALRQMGEKISRAPCEVILTMERGGTLLYDFLEPYIPASARPKIMISTAKPEPKSTSAHIKALIGEATKAYQAGYKKLGIVEVSISGNQLLSITRTLANSFNDVRDPNVELHFYIFKQTLSEREDISKLYGPKQEKVFAESSRMHLHMVKVPYLIGEDVKSQQEYDQELSYPINVIHPKLGFIQLFGSGGTRETLKQLVHGQYSSLDQLDSRLTTRNDHHD
ncbi:hypothetical protein [Endozoicomonas lisbonensis]|uniref:hypothetical protein n=1 Tax=Endozoicomonas lisbonensis TaxID=3120522 RepID=UPI0033977AD4